MNTKDICQRDTQNERERKKHGEHTRARTTQSKRNEKKISTSEMHAIKVEKKRQKEEEEENK